MDQAVEQRIADMKVASRDNNGEMSLDERYVPIRFRLTARQLLRTEDRIAVNLQHARQR